VQELLPDCVAGFIRETREITTMCMPESPVFKGIEPGDMSWFEVPRPDMPYSATGFFHLNRNAENLTILAQTFRTHGYLRDKAQLAASGGIPLFEVNHGKGTIVVSELLLEAGELDPIAQRLLHNLIAGR